MGMKDGIETFGGAADAPEFQGCDKDEDAV